MLYVDFDCRLLSTVKLQQKTDRSIEAEKLFPGPAKIRAASQVVINIAFILIKCIPLISFQTRAFYLTWIQQLLCDSTTLIH